jgi:hypothetical protein
VTGLDETFKLEAIYYSAPIPRTFAVLTILGTVFDKLYFPHVYLPRGGFDQSELNKEIARLESLPSASNNDTQVLLSMLRFIPIARILDGFCIFTADKENPFSGPNQIPPEMVNNIFEAVHGRPPPQFSILFQINHHKGIPGSSEHITYQDGYPYWAGALAESGRTHIPIVNDHMELPVPGFENVSLTDKAKALSGILAMECVRLALPELPLLRPEDLMEFRSENLDTLRTFRRSMLLYARELNDTIRGATREEVHERTKFFVQAEVAPVLDALRATMIGPARPWYKRAIDFGRVVPEIITGFFTMDPTTAIAKALTSCAGQFFTELTAKGEQRETLKRSGLYYLLKLKQYQTDKLP